MRMDHKPLFSVIVPVYKAEKYLEKCLKSILLQTFTDFELILVVRDAPDDRSTEICEAYAHNYDKITVVHQQSKGIAGGRKEGALIGKGRYYTCVESDDWISPKYLSSAAKVIEKYNPDVVCCGVSWDSGKKSRKDPVPGKSGLNTKDDIQAEIYPILIYSPNGSSFPSGLLAKFIRYDQYKKFQMDVEDDIYGEDTLVSVPCVFYANSLYIIPHCLYHKSLNIYSAMRQKSIRNLQNPSMLAQGLEKSIDLTVGDLQDQVNRLVVANLFASCATQFNRKDAWKVITNDILGALSQTYCARAIKTCTFSGYWEGEVALYALRKKSFFLMWIYNQYRYLKNRIISQK